MNQSQPKPLNRIDAQPIAAMRSRVLMPWRFAFCVYAIALTTATHWPRLRLAIGDEPAPGKIIHMLAFGGLAFLLWRTRWLGSGMLFLAVLLIWSLIDELTQGLPGLGRTVSWKDVASNWSGILIVFAGIQALRPVGGPLNRLRQQINESAIDMLFTRYAILIMVVISALIMAATVGGAATFIMWRVHPDGTIYAAFISIPAAGLGGAVLVIDALRRRELQHMKAAQRCILCGASCAEAKIDAEGLGRCQACARPFHIGQWDVQESVTRATMLRLSLQPVTLGIGLSLLAVCLYIAGVMLYMRYPQELQMLRRFDRLPMDMRLVFDMAVLGCIVSVAVYRFRTLFGRLIDEQDQRCRSCGHDVHATMDTQGIGRCPECSVPFIRLSSESKARIASALR